MHRGDGPDRRRTGLARAARTLPRRSGGDQPPAPDREFHVLAKNQLDERLMATPAVVGHAFLLRSKTHLYGFEEPPPGAK